MLEKKIDPRTKDILMLLGAGAWLAAGIVMPGLGSAIGHFVKEHEKEKWEQRKKSWAKYNQYRLRQSIKRLHQQKMVQVTEKEGVAVVELSNKGKRKYWQANLDELMMQKQKKWDKKWRLVIYDIPRRKKTAGEAFRRFLQKFKFLQLQKSVYLYPYPCENEIEFLRQYFGVGESVLMLTVSGLEHEEEYLKYFGL